MAANNVVKNGNWNEIWADNEEENKPIDLSFPFGLPTTNMCSILHTYVSVIKTATFIIYSSMFFISVVVK